MYAYSVGCVIAAANVGGCIGMLGWKNPGHPTPMEIVRSVLLWSISTGLALQNDHTPSLVVGMITPGALFVADGIRTNYRKDGWASPNLGPRKLLPVVVLLTLASSVPSWVLSRVVEYCL